MVGCGRLITNLNPLGEYTPHSRRLLVYKFIGLFIYWFINLFIGL